MHLNRSYTFVILLAGVAVGCDGGAWSSLSERWLASRPDDSAAAMRGEYGEVVGRRARDDCDVLGDPRPMAASALLIDRAPETSGASSADAGGDRKGAERLRLAVCEESCSDVRTRLVFEPAEDWGWRRTEGSAKMVDSHPAARQCEFEWRLERLVPTDSGIEWTTRVHRSSGALEGTSTCERSRAGRLADDQPCVRRRVVRAKKGASDSAADDQ